MPLTLEKYAEQLERRNEPCPAGPEPVPFQRAKPHLPRHKGIRSIIWSGYGTLLLIQEGEPHLLNPDPIMKKIALEKTIKEFKMWASMTRKPGEPSNYMEEIFRQLCDRMLINNLSAKHAELRIDRIWEGVIGRLMQKEYTYETSLYGEVPEFAQKIAYYYLRASQGVSAFPGELKTLRRLAKHGFVQGIFANGQCTTPVQLLGELKKQGAIESLEEIFDPGLCIWSFVTGFRKESDRSVAHLAAALAAKQIAPEEALVVGSDVEVDLAPAKRRGFRTALLLADRNSAKVTPEQLRDERTKPNVLLTQHEQILDVVT